MKSAQDLMSRIGGNMKESMGGNRTAPPTLAPDLFGAVAPPALRGEALKYHGATRIKDALSIPVARLVPDPDQPRKEFEPAALAELASSLKARGQLQPIRVRWDEAASRWVIVAGERRWRAAQLAGFEALACIEARGPLTPDDVLEDQLVENCVREDLKPIEQAQAFRALLDRRGWSHRQLAETLHIAPGNVAKALALLDLPAPIQEHVESGALSPTVAYELSKVADPAARVELAERVVSEGLTRAETVEAVKAAKPTTVKGRGAGKGKARKVTERTFRVGGGKLTLEHRRGVDDATALAMLREATAEVEARLQTDAHEAA